MAVWRGVPLWRSSPTVRQWLSSCGPGAMNGSLPCSVASRDLPPVNIADDAVQEIVRPNFVKISTTLARRYIESRGRAAPRNAELERSGFIGRTSGIPLHKAFRICDTIATLLPNFRHVKLCGPNYGRRLAATDFVIPIPALTPEHSGPVALSDAAARDDGNEQNDDTVSCSCHLAVDAFGDLIRESLSLLAHCSREKQG